MRGESSTKDAVGRFDVVVDLEAESCSSVLVLMPNDHAAIPPGLLSGCERFGISCRESQRRFGIPFTPLPNAPHRRRSGRSSFSVRSRSQLAEAPGAENNAANGEREEGPTHIDQDEWPRITFESREYGNGRILRKEEPEPADQCDL